MDEQVTYDADFFAWSQRQASMLRDLAALRRDLPDDLDVEHVAEEIEDVGRAELNSVQSFLRLILVHVIKAVSVPDAEPMASWRKEVVGFHNELRLRFSRSMRQRIDLDALWGMAIREAGADLAIYRRVISSDLPTGCPLDLDDLTGEGFAFDVAVPVVRSRIDDPVSATRAHAAKPGDDTP